MSNEACQSLREIEVKIGQNVVGWYDSKLFLFSYDLSMMLCAQRVLLKRVKNPNEDRKVRTFFSSPI